MKLNILTKLRTALLWAPSEGACATQWTQMETWSQLLCLAYLLLVGPQPKEGALFKLPNKLPFRISSPTPTLWCFLPHPQTVYCLWLQASSSRVSVASNTSDYRNRTMSC